MYKAQQADSFLLPQMQSMPLEYCDSHLDFNSKFPSFKKIDSIKVMNNEHNTTLPSSKLSQTFNYKQEDLDRFDLDETVKQVLSEIVQTQISNSQEKSKSQVEKIELTPSDLFRDGYFSDKQIANILFTVSCLISYGGKIIETICKVTLNELQFQNSGCNFQLNKITKMKILYEDYQKCIWFTYNDIKNNNNFEVKFKVYINNDVKDDLYTLFSKIIVQKLILSSFNINLLSNDDENVDRFILQGQIYKRSQFLGNWAMRNIIITDKIESFKGKKCTFQMKNIKQIWTRFDIYENNLILKIRHGSQKTQLAIPIVNYSVRFCQRNWMYRIYRLVSASII